MPDKQYGANSFVLLHFETNPHLLLLAVHEKAATLFCL